MVDILGNAASVLITFLIVAGFVACGAVVLFEIGAMLWFTVKHAFQGPSGRAAPVVPNRRRTSFLDR